MSEPSGTQYGGFWIRLIALLVDSAIVFMLSALLVAGAAVALEPELFPLVVLAASILAFLYWPLMHASGRQATIGKALLGLKVARLHGGRISILRSVGRELSKVLSGMVLMLGYVMAAFTPRKQALHDLVGSTYVVREGVSRLVPALAVVVAGFALPVVVVPMIVGAALMSTMTSMAQAMVSQPDPMKQAAPKPRPKSAVQTAKAIPPPQPAAVASPVPVQAVEQKPEPVAATPPAEPVPVAVIAKPEPKPVPVAMLESKPAEVVKPKATKPKVEAVKSKALSAPLARSGPAPRQAPSVPASRPKPAEGPKFNDLMTAVLYRDAAGVEELLKLGKWPDKADSRGVTPLMTAVELGDARTAEALLRGGANPKLAIPMAEERRDGEMILLLKRYSSR